MPLLFLIVVDAIAAGKTVGHLVNEEFGQPEFGDVRGERRLVRIVAGMAEDPERCISSSCGKSGAQAISQFFENKEATVESVLAAHVQ